MFVCELYVHNKSYKNYFDQRMLLCIKKKRVLFLNWWWQNDWQISKAGTVDSGVHKYQATHIILSPCSPNEAYYFIIIISVWFWWHKGQLTPSAVPWVPWLKNHGNKRLSTSLGFPSPQFPIMAKLGIKSFAWTPGASDLISGL